MADENMNKIYLLSSNVPDILLEAVTILMKGSNRAIQRNLSIPLRQIQEISKRCLDLAVVVENQFKQVTDLVMELNEACTSVQGIYEEELLEAKIAKEQAEVNITEIEKQKKFAEDEYKQSNKMVEDAEKEMKDAKESIPSGWKVIGFGLAEQISTAVSIQIGGRIGMTSTSIPALIASGPQDAPDTPSPARQRTLNHDVIQCYSKAPKLKNCIDTIINSPSNDITAYKELLFYQNNTMETLLETMKQGKQTAEKDEFTNLIEEGISIVKELKESIHSFQNYDENETDEMGGDRIQRGINGGKEKQNEPKEKNTLPNNMEGSKKEDKKNGGQVKGAKREDRKAEINGERDTTKINENKERGDNSIKNKVETAYMAESISGNNRATRLSPNKNVKEKLLALQEKVCEFESMGRSIVNASPSETTGPVCKQKIKSDYGEGWMTKLVVESAIYKQNLASEQLAAKREEKNQACDQMMRKSDELLRKISEVRAVKIREVNFTDIRRTLKEGIRALAGLQKEWTMVVKFFTLMSNLVEDSLNITLERLIANIQEGAECRIDEIQIEDCLKDIIYKQAFGATKIAHLVNVIAGCYVQISSDHLVTPIAGLGRLLSYNPETEADKIEEEEEIILAELEKAQESIKCLVNQTKEEFGKKVQDRINIIQSELGRALPAAASQHESYERIRISVQKGLNEAKGIEDDDIKCTEDDDDNDPGMFI